MSNLPTKSTKRIEAFLAKMTTMHGRLIFAIDMTGSREETWKRAIVWTGAMLQEAAKIGGLEIQLV
jgi:hypothetical protein